ncbi:cytidylyltransferase domain-containing protein [Polynucleobacter sp. UB-Raua-W9]|uniref:acylneuraminate cytidylyltransferase family protein n=1 Tax=Polynucleobacter sp. UB-Raua-W9 TaxID=1819736 RepID=UPI001BFD5F97|nr:acylneuraminate cytidylyltransferase family protein [Polynucleobacter sp. UB-Raua-W9]QWD72732.1 acylneuraminate cytidylyltransferase family protein [Polynucleobacter sp. UB-Raua-W9]
MKILALIPARGGSKRLVSKNLRELGGRPLISWSIEFAKKQDLFCDILVSTDSEEIAQISRDAGALVPWLRPIELASDCASSFDVAQHAIEWYEKNNGKIDAILLLQPTSPFRSSRTLSEAIKLFQSSPEFPLLTVSPAITHPDWALKELDNKFIPYFEKNGLNVRSQDLDSAFTPNGNLYLITPDALRRCGGFVGAVNSSIIIESKVESLDIDDEWDYEISKYIVSNDKYRNYYN